MNETQLPKHRKTQVPYEMGNRLARFELSLGAMSKNELVAGTSPSVPGDILGAYEELRWMSLIRPLHPAALLYENVQSTMRGQSLLWQR